VKSLVALSTFAERDARRRARLGAAKYRLQILQSGKRIHPAELGRAFRARAPGNMLFADASTASALVRGESAAVHRWRNPCLGAGGIK
jgi:hypothetical protein